MADHLPASLPGGEDVGSFLGLASAVSWSHCRGSRGGSLRYFWCLLFIRWGRSTPRTDTATEHNPVPARDTHA